MTEAAAVPLPLRRRVLTALLILVAVSVSLLFLYTGIEKWSDIGRFQGVIVSHHLLEGAAAESAAIALATAELGVGVLGLFLLMMKIPSATALTLLLGTTLFLVFAVYAALLVAQPPPEPTSCGCGVLSVATTDWPSIMTRSAVVAAVLGFAALVALRSVKTEPAVVVTT